MKGNQFAVGAESSFAPTPHGENSIGMKGNRFGVGANHHSPLRVAAQNGLYAREKFLTGRTCLL